MTRQKPASHRVPTKGELTRERIIAQAAPLFNQRGFAGASMADLIAASGLRAGGVYRHFDGKEALAIAAFDHAASVHGEFYAQAIAATTGAAARVAALADAMASIVDAPLVAGGCPLLNTAVETDDAHPALPALRNRVRRAMNGLIGMARRIFDDGVAAGEIASSVDTAAEARLVIATMEGATMLAALYGDSSIARDAAAQVADRARALVRETKARARRGRAG